MERVPPQGLLVMGLLWRRQEDLAVALKKASVLFGPVRSRSDVVPFDTYSRYYADEMGSGLSRCLVAAGRMPRGALADAKLATNRVESHLAREGMRTVNIDPGLLTLESLVLATTKPYTHRVYLGKGIYGELTLIFRKGRFEPLPWTYPDYRDGWARTFLEGIREELRSDGEREK